MPQLSKILFILIVILTILSCSKTNEPKINQSAKYNKDTLYIDLGAEIPSLDPQLAEDMRSIRVMNDLYAGLVTFDESNNIMPSLAESWAISSDHKTYTFYLRNGIKFSDGSLITTNDIIYSWRRLVDPKTGSPYTFIANSILNAKEISSGKLPVTSLGILARDNKTIIVTLAYPDSSFLAKLQRPSFYIVPRTVVEKYGREWISSSHIVTSGAYILQKHVVNGYLSLSRNQYYYNRSQVKTPHVIFYPLVDTNTAVSKYKADELDMTWQIPVDQYNRLKKEYLQELHVTPIEAVVYYNINLLKPELQDINLRKALSLAIDRTTLTKDVVSSGVTPLYSVITNTISHGKYENIVYQWENMSRSDQIKLAKKYYALASYSKIKPLKITITYFTNDEQKKVALAIASMWSNVLGAQVRINNQDWKTFLNTRRNGGYDISFGRWYADYDGVTTYTPIFECISPVNYTKFCNKAYDDLINQAQNTSNYQDYLQALTLALDSYSIIPLYQLVSTRLIKSWVKGYNPDLNHLDMVKSEWIYKD